MFSSEVSPNGAFSKPASTQTLAVGRQRNAHSPNQKQNPPGKHVDGI